MSIKRKSAPSADPRPCFNPYLLEPDDNMGVCYARYMADPMRIVQHGGRTYYKIFECLPFNIANKRGAPDRRGVLVWMTCEMPCASGDVLMDENGNCFASQIEMIYFRPEGLPKHYEVIYPLFLTGDTAKLGEYLTHKG